MPSAGRAVSLRVGCLSWSLSFGFAGFCAATTAAVIANDATPTQTRRRKFVMLSAFYGDNGEMVYSQLPLPVADADVVVVPWFEDDGASAVAGVDAATGGELQRALGTKELSGRLFEIFLTAVADSSWKTRRV